MMKKAIFISSLFVILVLVFTTYVFMDSSVISVTEKVKVTTKDQSETEQWIILANEKKVYIADVSIWALLNENEEYIISYESKKNSDKKILTSVVPRDFNGQF